MRSSRASAGLRRASVTWPSSATAWRTTVRPTPSRRRRRSAAPRPVSATWPRAAAARDPPVPPTASSRRAPRVAIPATRSVTIRTAVMPWGTVRPTTSPDDSVPCGGRRLRCSGLLRRGQRCLSGGCEAHDRVPAFDSDLRRGRVLQRGVGPLSGGWAHERCPVSRRRSSATATRSARASSARPGCRATATMV